MMIADAFYKARIGTRKGSLYIGSEHVAGSHNSFPILMHDKCKRPLARVKLEAKLLFLCVLGVSVAKKDCPEFVRYADFMNKLLERGCKLGTLYHEYQLTEYGVLCDKQYNYLTDFTGYVNLPITNMVQYIPVKKSPIKEIIEDTRCLLDVGIGLVYI